MEPKVLKNEKEYEAALQYLETLMDADPGSPEEEKLELFSLLVEEYEEEHYPIAPPDPIEAILFRMDQEGLTRKDLAQYIGSQSKVSEVLNGKRSLSKKMIRNLHEGLGIPADVLLKEPGRKLQPVQYDYRNFPFNAMLKKGYFGEWDGSLPAAKEVGEELLTQLFAPLAGQSSVPVYCRRTRAAIDTNALLAWQARALTLIQAQEVPEYKASAIDVTFFKKVVRASYFAEGPRLASSLLNERGIHFVVLPHLPKTRLDGATFFAPDGRPVIGMTLRHDRLDNFWFTLVHELAHVHLHLHDDGLAFFDDTEHSFCDDDDPREAEANAFARNALIPEEVWQNAGPSLQASSLEQPVLALADRLEISPAIVAGRVRWESGDYSRYSRLVGKGKVSKQFVEPTQATEATS